MGGLFSHLSSMRARIGCILFAMCFTTMLRADASVLPNGWTISAGLGVGRYDTDLEPRYRDDVFFDALLQPAVNPGTTGFGYGTPWQDKAHGGGLIDVSFRAARWFAGYDAYVAGSTPQYQSLTLLRNGGNNTTIVDDARVPVLARARGTFYGGIPVGLGNNVSMDVLAGLRVLAVHADYDSTLVSTTTSNTGARTDSVGITLESKSDSRAGGLVFGIEWQWKLNGKLQLRAAVSVHNLIGTWVLDKMNASATGASGAILPGAQLVHEDGEYQVKGGQVSLAGYYALDTDLNLFAAFVFEKSTTRDSGILRYDTNNFSNPSRLMLDYLLSQNGSKEPDAIGTFRMGVEKHIAW